MFVEPKIRILRLLSGYVSERNRRDSGRHRAGRISENYGAFIPSAGEMHFQFTFSGEKLHFELKLEKFWNDWHCRQARIQGRMGEILPIEKL